MLGQAANSNIKYFAYCPDIECSHHLLLLPYVYRVLFFYGAGYRCTTCWTTLLSGVMWSCKMFAMLRSFVLPVTVLRYHVLKRLAVQAVTDAYTRGSAQMCSVFRIRWSYIVCVGFCSFMLPVRDVQHLTLNGLQVVLCALPIYPAAYIFCVLCSCQYFDA
jgi:hypothetical protein